jgi:hypothetical protein
MNTLFSESMASRHSFWASIAVAFCLLFGSILLFGENARAQYGEENPCGCGDYGTKASATNTGQEFLLCFNENELPDYTTSSYQSIFLASVGDTATVTITSKQYPSYSKVYHLTANQALTYQISDDVDPLINSDEQVDNTVILVVSTSPIVCYGFNHKEYTTDAFLALPINTAQTEYRVMSYYNSTALGNANGLPYQSEFAVTAFEDNTTVTITPSALTSNGTHAGVPETFTLNAGQCVQVQADVNTLLLDLTGSHVHSDKPVLVYGAHVRAEVPVGFVNDRGSTSRNTLCEAIPPTTTWGQAFVCSGFVGSQDGDVCRVLAMSDSTVVSMNGNIVAHLNHDQWFDTLIKNPIGVQTSQPTLTGLISHTSVTSQGTGDPFFAIVPPMDETYTDFTFFTSADVTAFTVNVVMVVTEVSGIGHVTLDGTLIPAASFTTLPTQLNGMTWAIAQVALPTSGGHRITTTNDATHGITILAYGLGPVDGYGYTAGALLKPLRGILASGGEQRGIVHGTQLPNTVNIANILQNTVYLDSAKIILDGNAGKYYSASFTEDIATDIQHIDMGDDATLTVRVDPPLAEPVGATVKIYDHTAKWFDLEPSEVHIKIIPQAAAGVDQKNEVMSRNFVTNYPNPFTDMTTISFTMPTSGDVNLTVYDDLGRVVSTLMNREVAAGPYAVRFESAKLANGHYSYELRSDKLNIIERHSLLLVR